MIAQSIRIVFLGLVLSILGDTVFAIAPVLRGPFRHVSAVARTPAVNPFNHQTLSGQALWVMHSYAPLAPYLRDVIHALSQAQDPGMIGAILPFFIRGHLALADIPSRKEIRHSLRKPPKERRSWVTNTRNKLHAYWEEHVGAISDPWNSAAWGKAGHYQFTAIARKEYGSWGAFVDTQGRPSQSPREKIDQYWNTYAGTVPDRWVFNSWSRSGHEAFAEKASKEYGSWNAFVNLKGRPSPKAKLNDYWTRHKSRVKEPRSSESWKKAGHGNFARKVIAEFGTWNAFLEVQGQPLRPTRKQALETYWKTHSATIQNRWSSHSWAQSRHSTFVRQVIKEYGRWTPFVEEKRKQETMLALWQTPPQSVTDVRRSAQWIVAGHEEFVKNAIKASGSWKQWVKDQGLEPVWEETHVDWNPVIKIVPEYAPLTRGVEVEDRIRLSQQQEIELAHLKDQGNGAALEALMVSQYYTVNFWLDKFKRRPWLKEHLDDLRHAALFGGAGVGGLRRAVEKFDPDKKLRLVTSANKWIEGAIRREAKKYYPAGQDALIPLEDIREEDQPTFMSFSDRLDSWRETFEKILPHIHFTTMERFYLEHIREAEQQKDLQHTLGVSTGYLTMIRKSVITKAQQALSMMSRVAALGLGGIATTSLLGHGMGMGTEWDSASMIPVLPLSVTSHLVLISAVTLVAKVQPRVFSHRLLTAA